MKKYIAIAGNMGCGKSTLVDFLCKHYKLKPFFEPNEQNPYLKDFYLDMKRWAFKSQIYFLTHKFRIHQDLDLEEKTVVQDRTIYEDAEIFATNLKNSHYISTRDYKTYMELYRIILRSINPPDLMIYLYCSTRTIKKRIKKRGRLMEQSIPSSYLRKLSVLYERWYKNYKLSPTIAISTDNLDYISDFVARADLLDKIENHL